jgi:ribosomal-protein-alanine N-acetyltransferase
MEYIIKNNIDLNLIKSFLQKAGDSLKNFRYFDTRSYDVINNHLVTYLLFVPNQEYAIGYGHLEFEANKLWLGIAVSEHFKGKGFGNIMLDKLIRTARDNNFEEIFLTVDFDNKPAIRLYEKFGFTVMEKKNEHVQLMRLALHD